MNREILIAQIKQGLSTWQMADLNNTTQPNIRYWLKKYELKTQRTIAKETNTRRCLTCFSIKSEKEFYKKGSKYMSHCKKCYQHSYTEIFTKNKQLSIEYLGGKCINCGYNKCTAALEFHHLDPNEKDYNPSRLMRYKSFEKIKKELDKCVLLCANCHREEHHLPNSN